MQKAINCLDLFYDTEKLCNNLFFRETQTEGSKEGRKERTKRTNKIILF
jgi:hypothetical protein